MLNTGVAEAIAGCLLVQSVLILRMDDEDDSVTDPFVLPDYFVLSCFSGIVSYNA